MTVDGTDTCIKLGGYVRVDTTFNTGAGAYGNPMYSGDAGQGNRYRDYFLSRSRMAITVDTRTATEYGVVRTFGQGDFQFNNFGSSNPNAITAFPGGAANALNTAGGGYVGVEMVFIQFAGFTFGKSASAFATPWNGYPGNNNSYLMGGPDYVTGVNNIQYTAQFGNGVSATISLDDPTVFNRTYVLNLGVAATPAGFVAGAIQATAAGANAYGGTHVPDIAGNIRVDQAWGLFQISGIAAYGERFVQPSRRWRRSERSVGDFRSPRRQVGRCGERCVADQEPPDRCGRRYQDRRNVLEG